MEANETLLLACIMALFTVSAILAQCGPRWLPRLALVIIALNLVSGWSCAAWPPAPDSLAVFLRGALASGAAALTLTSQFTRVDLPRQLVWIRALAWVLCALGALTVALIGDEWPISLFLGSVMVAVGAAWFVPYGLVVHALRLVWFQALRKTAVPALSLWASLAIYALATPALALFLYGLGNPIGSGTEVAPIASLEAADVPALACLLLGMAIGGILIFGRISKATPNTARAPRPGRSGVE